MHGGGGIGHRNPLQADQNLFRILSKILTNAIKDNEFTI